MEKKSQKRDKGGEYCSVNGIHNEATITIISHRLMHSLYETGQKPVSVTLVFRRRLIRVAPDRYR